MKVKIAIFKTVDKMFFVTKQKVYWIDSIELIRFGKSNNSYKNSISWMRHEFILDI